MTIQCGKLYIVGVGPGDAELLTMKAVRILNEADVIALPEAGGERQTAWSVVAQLVAEKETLLCPAPMVRSREKLSEIWQENAQRVCGVLAQGKDVAFVTLGDPSIYSTGWYLHEKVIELGYESQLVSGVPSFCAAAAGLNRALCEGSEPLVILPAGCDAMEKGLSMPGTKVIMKAGRQIETLREQLRERGQLSDASVAVNCGLPGEKYMEKFEDYLDAAGYFAVVLVKQEKR